MGRPLAPMHTVRELAAFPELGVDYIVFKDTDGTVYAKNGRTGKIEFRHSLLSSILSQIYDVHADGVSIVLAGQYDEKITIQTGTRLNGINKYQTYIKKININGGHRIKLENLKVKEIAIDVSSSSLIDSVFRDLWVYGDDTTTGLSITGTANEVTTLVLENVFFEHYATCVSVERPSDILYINAVFENSGTGIYKGSGRHILLKCWFESLTTGLDLIGSSYVTLIEPKFTNVTTPISMTEEYGYNPKYTVLGLESILQNFVIPTTQPSNPIPGSMYFDTSTGDLYVYDGSAWKKVTLT